MKKLSPILVLMAAVVSFALPASALASPWRGGDHSYGYGYENGQGAVICSAVNGTQRHARPYRAGGPPPWAPAHGWRRKHDHHADRPYYYFCADQALDHLPDGETPDGETIVWEAAGEPYRVTPTRSDDADGGRYCREYTATAVVAGREQQIYGTACRQPDGAWELQN
jgi:hypothetical protein